MDFKDLIYEELNDEKIEDNRLYLKGYEQGRTDERAKVTEEIISQAYIKISASHIWDIIVYGRTKDASYLSDIIADYFMETIREIAEELTKQ